MPITTRSFRVRVFPSLVMLLALLCILPSRAFAQALPSGWATQDIGSPKVAGSATYASSKFTVAGAGTDVWYAADQFRFVYRQMNGDGVVVARVDSLQQANVWSKAGVMIRESLGAGAKNAFTLASSAKGLAFQRRTATNGQTVSTIAGGAPPRWVKVQRAGATFTSSVSTDGATWQVIGTQSITMASTTFVGLAVTSHDANKKVAAVFSSVAVTQSTTPPPTGAAPTLTITAPSNGATVRGTVALTGTAADDGGVAKVEVSVDGGAYSAASGTLNWSASLNTTALSNGAHTVSARATDTGGLTAVKSVSITVSNTTTAP